MAKNTAKTNGTVFTDYDTNKPIDAADAVALGKAYRTLATAALPEGQTLDGVSDEAIAEAVRNISGNGTPVDMKRAQAVVALISNVDDTGETGDTDIPERGVSAIYGEREAVDIGSKMDTEALQHWSELADNDEKTRGAPIILADDIVRVAGGGDKKKGMAIVLRMPPPGTRAGKEKTFAHLRPGFNGPFEHTKHDLDGTDKWLSYYTTLFEASAQGKWNRDLNNFLVQIVKVDSVTPPGAANRFEELQKFQGCTDNMVKTMVECINSVSTRNMVKAWNDNRRSIVIRKLRVAVNYLQRKAEIDGLHGFRVVLSEKTMVHLARRTKPLDIQWTPTQEQIEEDETLSNAGSGAISIGAMIKLKPWLAKVNAEKEGKTLAWHHLKDTAKRNTDKKTVNTHAIKSVDDFKQALYSMHAWLSEQDNRTAVRDTFNTDEGKMVIASVHRVGMNFESFRGDTATRFNKMVAEENSEAEDDVKKSAA